jgi:spectinomycin phosphotransferase
MTHDHWRELGAVLKQIHETDWSDSDLADLPKEHFKPQDKWHGLVKQFDTQVESQAYQTDIEQELATFWLEKRREIRLILHRTEALGQLMLMKSANFVLCHADIHTWNILITPAGIMFIVDWDEVIVAPKERDFMFIVGGKVGGIDVGPQAEALFFTGYGERRIDQAALAYYRYEWVLQEIADYGKRIFMMDDLGAESKAYALAGFKSLFQPGDVVEAAFNTKTMLPPTY